MGTGAISLPEIKRLSDKTCKNVLCVVSLEGNLNLIQNILQSHPMLVNVAVSQVNECNLVCAINILHFPPHF